VSAAAIGTHAVDVPPELAPLGSGYLSASVVSPGRTLRLAGALDAADAGALADVIDEHFPGDLRADLADLSFVDIAGIHALLGGGGRRVTITRASRPVRRLLSVLGEHTIPGVEIAATD
jgi:ABC-type transporter Mla MlaB component